MTHRESIKDSLREGELSSESDGSGSKRRIEIANKGPNLKYHSVESNQSQTSQVSNCTEEKNFTPGQS